MSTILNPPSFNKLRTPPLKKGGVIVKYGMDRDSLIENLKMRRQEIKTKLDKRRLDMADQDGPNVSRYITATRWMVEQDIEDLDKELTRIDSGIKEVEKLIKTGNRFDEKYFVADSFEYIELGIISKKSPMGEKILAKIKT
jgi:hypothetical protein